jgi:protein NrfD
MNEFTTTRTNAFIDPHVHVWHYEIPVYLFLGGLVAGVMILTGLAYLKNRGAGSSRALMLAPWAAPILLSVGMFFLWLDLANGFNAWRFYMVLKPSSPMSWGSWILLAVYPASILLGWVMLPERYREWTLHRVRELPVIGDHEWPTRLSDWALENTSRVAVATVLAGAALGIYTGVLLGTMAARPMWNSAILGPLFLTSGLSTGAAFLLLMNLGEDERKMLGRLDMGLISVELLLLALWMVGLATGGEVSRAAFATIWGGPFTAPFWTLVVTLGLLTPLAGEWVELRHNVAPGRFAAVLVLVGGFALRWILVYAGQMSGFASELALH